MSVAGRACTTTVLYLRPASKPLDLSLEPGGVARQEMLEFNLFVGGRVRYDVEYTVLGI